MFLMAFLLRAFVSRRSRVLILMGVVFVVTGISYLTLDYPIALAENYPPLQAHMRLFGLTVWAWIFIASGATAILAGFIQRHTLGFVALMSLSSCWSLLYFVSWAMNGYWRAVTQGSALWLLVAALLAALADWPDPIRLTIRENPPKVEQL